MNKTHYNTAEVRSPAVAGSFYPASASRLQNDISDYLKQARQHLNHNGLKPLSAHRPLAIIAPHAGYIYSGPIAASAYALLPEWKQQISRVILLGPVHRVAVEGVALPSMDYFETPLGTIKIDDAARQQLLRYAEVEINDAAHAQEHSLEVQLPFLQSVLSAFTLLPIAVGDISTAALARIISALWNENTLIVVSSDLSHYHDYQTAKELDNDTCQHICQGDLLNSYQQACGAVPINGLLQAAQAKNLHATLIDARNSGDTSGDKARVVGYASFAFFQETA